MSLTLLCSIVPDAYRPCKIKQQDFAGFGRVVSLASALRRRIIEPSKGPKQNTQTIPARRATRMKIAFDVDVLAKQMSINDYVHKVADWGYKYICLLYTSDMHS